MGILSYIQNDAFRRFMKGTRGPWGPLAVAVFGVRMLVKWSGRRGDVVYREVLAPGEEVRIVHTTDTRTTRKKADRSAAKSKRHAKKADRHADSAVVAVAEPAPARVSRRRKRRSGGDA